MRLFLKTLLVLAAALPALAADPVADWKRLGTIDPGQRVYVRFWSGQVRMGTIQKVEGESLMFIEGSGATPVKREDIADIRVKSRARGAMWGALVGAGIGAPIGVAAAGGNHGQESPQRRGQSRLRRNHGRRVWWRRSVNWRGDREGAYDLPRRAEGEVRSAELAVGT